MPCLPATAATSLRKQTGAICLSLALAALTLSVSLAAQTPAPLQVKYTGRLFGYYSIEANEPMTENFKLPAVRKFLSSLEKGYPNAPADTLLLGMGDNFGPEFAASIQQEFKDLKSPCSDALTNSPKNTTAPAQWHLSAPEALYKRDDRLPRAAECDNVARFLMAAGYWAIVPGREDFIYSATWLRQIGLRLKEESSKFPDPSKPDRKSTSTPVAGMKHPLHLLAANIRIKAKNTCPLLFADPRTSKDHACPDSANAITPEMDWARRLQITLDSDAVVNSLRRQADEDLQFRMQTVVNQMTLLNMLLLGYQCKDMIDRLSEFAKETSFVIKDGRTLALARVKKSGALDLLVAADVIKKSSCPVDEMRALAKGALMAVCHALGDASPTDCKQVEAASTTDNGATANADTDGDRVLLSRDLRQKALDLVLNLIYDEQKDVGFTLATLPSGRHVLLIGVVGQETMQQISRSNFSVAIPDAAVGETAGEGTSKTAGEPGKSAKAGKKKATDTSGDLTVGDPRLAVTTVLRAAWAARKHRQKDEPNSPPLFDTVIVMAQMPPAEAQELAAMARGDLHASQVATPGLPSIDLVLSEAQDGHATPNLKFSMEPGSFTPVLVPPNAWQTAEGDPFSTAILSYQTDPKNGSLTQAVENQHTQTTAMPASTEVYPSKCQSAACLLKTELEKPLRPQATTGQKTDLETMWEKCKRPGRDRGEDKTKNYEDISCQNTVLMQYLLRQLQRSSHADLVLLERRDFYFGSVEAEESDSARDEYPICTQWINGLTAKSEDYKAFYNNYCHLKVALDRVLWKGDYSERVMVDGATLTKMIATAKKQTDQEQSLLANDVHEGWLMTYGLVTNPPENLANASSGPEAFSIPGVQNCNNAGKGSSVSPYCINGQPIVADRAYWVATSDQLAQDTVVYKDLSALVYKDPATLTAKPGYAMLMSKLFITSEIADEVTRHVQAVELPAAQRNAGKTDVKKKGPEADLAMVETGHQNRNLLQLDFTKLVAGYTFTSPDLSDAALAADYSGVSNTQAITPHAQELDLEAASRMTSAPVFQKQIAFGVQTDSEYDRKYLGNLTGSPEAVSYAANSFTAGGLVQVALHCCLARLASKGANRSTRNLPRAFLVLAPYQYQRQMTGTFLSFAFIPAAPAGSPQQQLTLHLPTAMGFSQRAGLRYEFVGITKQQLSKTAGASLIASLDPDPGSYFEVGPEYSVQNNILAGIAMPQLAAAPVCNVIATQSIQTCVKNAYKAAGGTLNASSRLIPLTESLHTGGLYWDAHVVKSLDKDKRYSVSFDTKGDTFLLPGATLTTQTRYALNTKLALNFKVFGNLALSPTYSDFFFENQGISSQRTSLVATTFSIAAKWYFARDSAVPFHKQIWFQGPASVDQTSSAKVK